MRLETSSSDHPLAWRSARSAEPTVGAAAPGAIAAGEAAEAGSCVMRAPVEWEWFGWRCVQ
ncbi:Uncharacterised protein [Bordetella pertussis]|nr:Uncharacterised protein [Bordetella pertussis]